MIHKETELHTVSLIVFLRLILTVNGTWILTDAA